MPNCFSCYPHNRDKTPCSPSEREGNFLKELLEDSFTVSFSGFSAEIRRLVKTMLGEGDRHLQHIYYDHKSD